MDRKATCPVVAMETVLPAEWAENVHFAGEFAYNWVARDTHPYLSAVGVTPQFLKILP